MNIIEVGPGLISIPPTKFGAIERVIWQLNLALISRGHDVTILNSPVITRDQVENIPSDAVVHCHWAGHARTLKKFGVPYAYTSHSHIWEQTCWDAIWNSQKYLALHPGMVPNAFPSERLEIVGNGVDKDIWMNENRKRSPRIVACANYSERKRLEWIFDLIALLPEPWTGMVIGPNVPANLEREHMERITLLGEMYPHEIVKIYNHSTVGFHPASEEAYALVPMEMASCGLMTLVANECYVYPRLSSITPFEDVGQAAEIILRLAPSYNSKSYSNAAQIHCSWDLVAERVEKGLGGL